MPTSMKSGNFVFGAEELLHVGTQLGDEPVRERGRLKLGLQDILNFADAAGDFALTVTIGRLLLRSLAAAPAAAAAGASTSNDSSGDEFATRQHVTLRMRSAVAAVVAACGSRAAASLTTPGCQQVTEYRRTRSRLPRRARRSRVREIHPARLARSSCLRCERAARRVRRGDSGRAAENRASDSRTPLRPRVLRQHLEARLRLARRLGDIGQALGQVADLQELVLDGLAAGDRPARRPSSDPPGRREPVLLDGAAVRFEPPAARS